MGITRLLTYARRLILVNSVCSAIPVFYMCTLKVPPTVIDQVDKYRKGCLWNGGDLSKKWGCLVAWKVVMRPKEEGDLGGH